MFIELEVSSFVFELIFSYAYTPYVSFKVLGRNLRNM